MAPGESRRIPRRFASRNDKVGGRGCAPARARTRAPTSYLGKPTGLASVFYHVSFYHTVLDMNYAVGEFGDVVFVGDEHDGVSLGL